MTEHLGCLLPGVFFSGTVFGAVIVFYLMKWEILVPGFNPLPLLALWLLVAFSWVLG